MLRNFKNVKNLSTFLMFAVICLSCSNTSMQSPTASPAPEKKLTAVERDVKSMKTANFEFIFVIRRNDGGVLNTEDKAYIKSNSPADTNRFVLSDDDKAVVAGSSYKFEPEYLEKLRERFLVEDFSAPVAAQFNNNTDANAGKPAEK